MKPAISLLIANYNNGKYFRDCYQSLINQSEKNWEAIIIDDCSTDGSVTEIETLIKDDDRFLFYKNEENVGYQKTIIKAVSFSSSDLFARLDPDDSLSDTAIQETITAHHQNPNCGLVYSNFTICDEDLKPKGVHRNEQLYGIQDFSKNLGTGITHFAVFKKAIYNLTDGFDSFNKRAEDQDIYMKMAEIAPVLHIDKELYLYRIHSRGASTNKNREKALFWHWVALIDMSRRQNINLENEFTKFYIPRSIYNQEKDKTNVIENNFILKTILSLAIKVRNFNRKYL